MLRIVSSSVRNFVSSHHIVKPTYRSLGVSSWLSMKEIRERQEGDTLIFEGVEVKSPRERLLVKSENNHGACPLCALGLDVKHTDILIIKQFIDHDAKLFPRRITGLCRWQQRKMQYLVEMAKRAGLINPLVREPIPAYQKGWRGYNTYFDENEIPQSKMEYRLQKQREFEEAYRIAKAERDAHEEMLRKQREERRK
ncbi:28S ribosomal protein S18a, mitochondrial [Frankliniella fusca]|uniref:28S ribosomal protein S18a, mitochondrial n=1 Tax=Frankliniella fusca TaxID=407009 RepID=A0AAE1L7Q8_9NEOP|nr:28S ribosomal protein S18a, mitochondrial [Frankliniella fusca]